MIDVVHLVWAALGRRPFERFLDSYRQHSAGAAHRLVLVFKEFHDVDHRRPWEELASDVDYRRVDIREPALDLAAYWRVACSSDASRLCFTNSSSVVLADGWLAVLDRALERPHVGIAGATGSWESTYSAAPIWRKPLLRRSFGPFPNPHIRTNGFLLDRELMLSLDWPDVGCDKRAALRLENGRRGITAQVRARGSSVVVVGRDERAYEPPDWPRSGTFRSGEQANLLVADNRTEQYREAARERRRELERFAWGEAVDQSTGSS